MVLKDGNIAVYNLQRRSRAPVFVSGPGTGKHRETVWQVNKVRVTVQSVEISDQLRDLHYPSRCIMYYELDRMLAYY